MYSGPRLSAPRHRDRRTAGRARRGSRSLPRVVECAHHRPRDAGRRRLRGDAGNGRLYAWHREDAAGGAGDDLISNLIRAREAQRALSEDELIAQCVLLLIAGHETTTNLIGNGLLALLRHPDRLTALRENPALIESAVEELLRYDSPVQFTGRTATEDVMVGDQTIAVGQRLTLWLGAANHDPAQFPDPDTLDLGREPDRHLSFAAGPHFCVGAALGAVGGQIAIGTVLERLPMPRLATDVSQWRRSLSLRGLTALPVTFGQ